GNTLYAGPVIANTDGQQKIYYYAYSSAGSMLWKTSTAIAGGNMSATSISDGVLAVGIGGRSVYAFATKDGRLLWQQPLDCTVSSLTVADYTVYVTGVVPNLAVVCAFKAFNGTDGTVRWDQTP